MWMRVECNLALWFHSVSVGFCFCCHGLVRGGMERKCQWLVELYMWRINVFFVFFIFFIFFIFFSFFFFFCHDILTNCNQKQSRASEKNFTYSASQI
ncbi:hypothetical protein BGX38DRAFT_1161856, partial [Terfezia claveryi]